MPQEIYCHITENSESQLIYVLQVNKYCKDNGYSKKSNAIAFTSKFASAAVNS